MLLCPLHWPWVSQNQASRHHTAGHAHSLFHVFEDLAHLLAADALEQAIKGRRHEDAQCNVLQGQQAGEHMTSLA
jgi:hypothetical protein